MARSTSETLETFLNRLRENIEKKLESNTKKKKKSKKTRHASSSSESEEEEKTKKVKKPRRSRFAVDIKPPSNVVEMKPVNSDDDEEAELYCYCQKPESIDMIGCDFCTEWFHPTCISLDEKEIDEITNTSAWMCPECIEREAKEEADSDGDVKKKKEKEGTSQEADGDSQNHIKCLRRILTSVKSIVVSHKF
jgi:hypothetical protein